MMTPHPHLAQLRGKFQSRSTSADTANDILESFNKRSDPSLLQTNLFFVLNIYIGRTELVRDHDIFYILHFLQRFFDLAEITSVETKGY